jgi:hypothetical protein
MRRTIASLAMVGTVTLAGCNLDLVNPNNPTSGGAANDPRGFTSTMITGVIATYRDNRSAQIRALGSFGRETYFMFLTDGRFITGPYKDWKTNNSFEAGSQWGGRYGNYRNAYEAMKVINGTGALTAGEKAGANGMLKTIIALDLLHVIEARGAIGAVVDMTDDVNAVHPLVTEDSTYKWISAKLDEAKGDLTTAGTTPFYFPLNSGFSAFGVAANTPAGFVQFNRAIKARVEVKRGSLGCGAPCYNTALTALTGTWIANLTGTAANRDAGVYSVFSTAAGDALNGVSLNGTGDMFVHPGIDSILGVANDDRFIRKTVVVPQRTEVGVKSSRRPTVYTSNVDPIPIIRNEELILLRAEAEWFAGAGTQAAAVADLASVRTNSGSLNGHTAAVAFATPTTDAQFTSELLLQRTLSLLEEAQRWVDYRRFGQLAALGTLLQDVTAGFTVASASVLPSQECDARSRVGAPAPMSCPGGPAVP